MHFIDGCRAHSKAAAGRYLLNYYYVVIATENRLRFVTRGHILVEKFSKLLKFSSTRFVYTFTKLHDRCITTVDGTPRAHSWAHLVS